MTVPPPVLEERRNYTGWVLLVAIGVPLLLYVSAGFFSEAFTPASRARGCVTGLQTAVRMDRMGGQFHGDWDSVGECVAKIAPARSKDELSAMVYAAARGEQGKPVQASDLTVLANSKYQRHRAFAQAYGEGPLSKDQAEELVREMPDTSFVYALAKVHALDRAGVPGGRDRYVGKHGLPWAVLVGGLALMGLCVVGLGLWVTYAVMRSLGKLIPMGHPLGKLTRPDSDRCALRAAQFLLIYIGASFASAFIDPICDALRIRQPDDALLLVIHSTVLAGLMYAVMRFRVDGKSLGPTELGVRPRGFWRHAGWGLAGLVANAPIFLGVTLFSQWAFGGIPQVEHPIMTHAKQAIGLLTPLLLLVGASVFAPLIEETWFRGTLLPALSTAFKSPVWGVIVTSLIFASMHPTGLPSWLPLASIGAMGAMLTYQTRSLVPAMVMHALHNGITLAFALAMG